MRPIKTATNVLTPKICLKSSAASDNSVRSMIVGGLARDNQTRKEDLVAKIDRKRFVATEHGYRKQSVDENSVKPWENREHMNWKQYKNQISRKPHHENRYDCLI